GLFHGPGGGQYLPGVFAADARTGDPGGPGSGRAPGHGAGLGLALAAAAGVDRALAGTGCLVVCDAAAGPRGAGARRAGPAPGTGFGTGQRCGLARRGSAPGARAEFAV